MSDDTISFIADTLRMDQVPKDHVVDLCVRLRDSYDMINQLQQTIATLNGQVSRLTYENEFLTSFLNDASVDLDDLK
jgi:hypothetical protein